jgi:hypothetical protein
MPASLDYRQRAEDCIRRPAASQDIDESATLLQLAEQWARLADHEGKRARGQYTENNQIEPTTEKGPG